jgi:hypothetical protein
MASEFNKRDYQQGSADPVLEKDEEQLRLLLRDLPGPEEPHPAYWNNFLIRVHERIDQTAPQKKAWWSPALIWGSLSGVALLLVFAVAGKIGPFGNGTGQQDPLFADLNRQAEELVLVPGPRDDTDIIGDIASDNADDANYSIVLTESDIDMINAIDADDGDAILQGLIDDIDLGEI